MSGALVAGAKITDKMLEELRATIGQEQRLRLWYNAEASIDTIRHFTQGVGDPNPLYLDEDYAKRTRFGGLIAPPTFLYSCGWRAPRPGLPGVHGMYSGSDWEFYLPVRLGDRIIVTAKLVELVERPSQFAGRQFEQITELFYRNQRGEVLARQLSHSMRMERDTARQTGKYQGIQKKKWTGAELAEVWRGYEREEIRGAKPRYWEDVEAGEELSPVLKGPLTGRDCIAFVMGWGSPFIRTGKVNYEYMKRHPAAYIANEQGIPDVPERVHWTDEFAARVGVPGAYDYGPQRISWLGHLMTNWIGDDGWLKELRAQVRLFNIHGDVQSCKGRVTKKYIKEREHLVECEIWAENQRGEVTAPGFAKVVLPSRAERNSA
jgi:acyl dehydratase